MSPTATHPNPRLPRRLAARALDITLLVAVAVGFGNVIGFGYDWLGITAGLVLVYFAGLDALFGTTLGKALLGLRVTAADGRRPTTGQALIRESFTVLGAVPYAGPFLALGAWTWIVLTIRSSPLGQGVHDMLAGGTRVVRTGELYKAKEFDSLGPSQELSR